MTKVLVTGQNSRQCNVAKNQRDVLISWLIAEVCRDLGYEVEQRNPTVEETYDEFDHVFLGQAPLHSLGSNRTYGALSCYLRTVGDNRVTLYQDDVNNQNVMNGIRTVHNDPFRLTKPFFNYKLEFAVANTPKYRTWLESGVHMLNNYAWPETIIPAFPWADISQLTSKCPNLVKPVPLDLSAYLPEFDEQPKDERIHQWVAEVTDPRWFHKQRIDWYAVMYGKGYDKRPTDEGLFKVYTESWAVLDRGYDHGWWSSRMAYAARARTLYVTKWQNVEVLGEPYWSLPYQVEELTAEDRDKLANAQYDAFTAASSTKDDVRATIKRLVEK